MTDDDDDDDDDDDVGLNVLGCRADIAGTNTGVIYTGAFSTGAFYIGAF